MTHRIFRLGLVFSGAYLGLYLVATLFMISMLVTRPATSEFSAIGMVLVTFPWSLAWIAVSDWLGILRWYEPYAGTPALYGVLASLTLLPAAIPYTVGLYVLGRSLEKRGS